MFHNVLNICQLRLEFPPNSLPPTYGKKQSCGHLLHVELDTISTKALYLTMLEKVSGESREVSFETNESCVFINAVIYKNPVWDLGMQHKLALQNLVAYIILS